MATSWDHIEDKEERKTAKKAWKAQEKIDNKRIEGRWKAQEARLKDRREKPMRQFGESPGEYRKRLQSKGYDPGWGL